MEEMLKFGTTVQMVSEMLKRNFKIFETNLIFWIALFGDVKIRETIFVSSIAFQK